MQTQNLDAKRAPLTLRQKQLMLAVLMRDESTFRTVQPKLAVRHFRGSDEQHLALLWDVLQKLHSRDGGLPSSELLSTELSARLEDDPNVLTDPQIDDLDAVMDMAYSLELSGNDKRAALLYTRQLLEESLQFELQERVASQTGILDLPAILLEAQSKVEGIASLETGALPTFFPDSIEDLPALVVETSGYSWIDYYMDGGMARKEVYGFLGPYGSCKTTLAVGLSVNRAKWEQAHGMLAGSDGPFPTVYLVAWEEEREQLQFRAMSFEADIRKDSLAGAGWYSKLSRAGTYKDYEKELFKDALRKGVEVPGELERLDACVKMLNKNLRLIDFTGADPQYRGLSVEMTRGVAAAIEADQTASGNPGVSMVVLDYAGAAAKRCLGAKNKDPDRLLRHYIGSMPMAAKAEIAIPFNCPVWLMHQTGTDAQGRSTGSLPRAVDAAEGRNFAENLNFAFLIGTVSEDQTCAVITRKQRRASRKPPKILRIDGEFCRVVDVSETYCLRNNRIDLKEYSDKVADSLDDDGAVTPPDANPHKPVVVVQDSLFTSAGTNGPKHRAVAHAQTPIRRKGDKDST